MKYEKARNFKNIKFEDVSNSSRSSISQKLDDEVTSYFYRNCFKSMQELYNYIVNYVDYLEHQLKIHGIPYVKRNIRRWLNDNLESDLI